jgi:predicted nucleic acid-binding protein
MIYVDAGIIMRIVEGADKVRLPIEAKLRALPPAERVLVTSRLSKLECCCKPLRDGNSALLGLYDEFFLRAGEVVVKEIDSAVIEEATHLRAKTSLKTPDAIHAATATLCRVQSFWTADRRFQQCPGLPPVELLPAI